MTRIEALKELAAKVEAGSLPEAVFHGFSGIRGHWAYLTGLDGTQRRNVFLAYNGSLDAALALHEAVLPEWCWSVDRLGQAIVWYPWVEGDSIMHEAGGNDGAGDWRLGPARAWLLAILRALIAQEGDDT